MKLNRSLEIPEHVLFRNLDEEMVLLNLETGYYFALDEVGSRIWQLLQEGRDLAAIQSTLEGEYEVDPADLEADLLELVEALREHGLVQPAQEPARDEE